MTFLGDKRVNIEIPKEVFATPEELDALEILIPGCEHDWFGPSFPFSKFYYRKMLRLYRKVFCLGVNTHCGNGVHLGDRKLWTTLRVDSFVSRGIAFKKLVVGEGWEFTRNGRGSQG